MSYDSFHKESACDDLNAGKISGYEMVKGILNLNGNRLDSLLDCAEGREHEWLEFKAGMHLLPQDQVKETDEDLWWNITKAVIGMMNTTGGAVIIGLSDKLNVVPLEECDPRGVIESSGIDRYFREEILGRICPQKTSWITSKGDSYSLEGDVSDIGHLLDIKTVTYQGHKIAALLVQPKTGKCIRVFQRVLKNKNLDRGVEIVFSRKKGVGKTEEIVYADNIISYEEKRIIVDEEYTAILKKAGGMFASKNVHPFYGSWRAMIQKLEGMESLLRSNEHDALKSFCEIVEKAICDMDMFCNRNRRDLSLEDPEIQEVWQQLKSAGVLERKLKIDSALEFPDLSKIESLKELDRQHSSKLKTSLCLLFYEWKNFAEELAGAFPAETEEEAVPIQNNLPRAFVEMEFVGREEQLNDLLRFLSHREARSYFLTITGEGGMGKTTLALAAAYAVLNSDPKTSGVAKEDLAYQNIIWASAKERDFKDQREYSLDPDIEDYGGLLDTILSVVDPGHSLGDLKTKENRVRQILQGTRSLLIVDNMETINDDQLFHYLHNKIPAPTKIIGTDRNRPKTDRAIQLPPMNLEESKSLIKSLAKNKTDLFTEKDYEAFHSLSYGIPKVIEWGCRLLATQDVEVEDVFRYLIEAKKGRKNQIYEYLFGFSYDQLTPNAKKILNTLAMFDFPVQCSLIGKLAKMEKGLDDYIQELSSFTLLSIVSINGKERSVYHKYASVQDYIRDYAATKAESSPDYDKDAVYSNARKVFLDEIVSRCGTNGWPHKEAYNWCQKNIMMIRWVFQQFIDCSKLDGSENNIRNIRSFILSVIPVLSNIGMPDEIDRFCKISLALVLNILEADPVSMDLSDYVNLLLDSFKKTTDRVLKNIAAEILENWAWNMFRQARNNYVEVSNILNTLRQAAPEIESPKVNMLVLRTLALIDKEQNDLDNAEKKLLEVVDLARQNGDLYIEAITYGSLGSAYRDKNDIDMACNYMEKAFSKLEEIEDQDSVLEVRSVFYQKYAKLKITSGKIEEAEPFIQRAMLIDQAIGRQYGFAHNKRLMASIYERKKNYSQAYRLISEARALFVRLNSGKEVESDYERIKALYENQQFT